MTDHHTKRSARRPSQNSPSAAPRVTSDLTLADTYVGLCDWHGVVVWKSGTGPRLKVGEELWKNVVGPARDTLKAAVASVVTLRENQMLEVENDRQEHFRLWMWPLDDPGIALAILAMRIPSELALLTD